MASYLTLTGCGTDEKKVKNDSHQTAQNTPQINNSQVTSKPQTFNKISDTQLINRSDVYLSFHETNTVAIYSITKKYLQRL